MKKIYSYYCFTSDLKINQISLTLLTLLFFAFSHLAESKTIYVKSTGSDGNTGLSWGSPYLTIRKAVQVATNGDVIYVAAGTYNYTNTVDNTSYIDWNKEVSIYGSFDSTNPETDPSLRPKVAKVNAGETYPTSGIPWQYTNKTIINFNENWQRCRFLTSSSAASSQVFDGFIVEASNTNGNVPSMSINGNTREVGGGCIIENNRVLKNCIISKFKSLHHGGGAYLFAGGLADGCFFINNYVSGSNIAPSDDASAGGCFISGGAIATRCQATNNYGYNGGGFCVSVNGAIYNCIANNNLASNLGGGVFNNNGSVINCVIASNDCSSHGDGIAMGGTASAKLYNSVIWGHNDGSAGVWVEWNSGGLTISNCAFNSSTSGGWAATSMSNTQIIDGSNNSTQFVDPSTGNGLIDGGYNANYNSTSVYRNFSVLKTNMGSSKLDNTGNRSFYNYAQDLDFWGKKRGIKQIDIGAHEIQPLDIDNVTISGTYTYNGNGQTPTIVFTTWDDPASYDLTYRKWGSSDAYTSSLPVDAGDYEVKLVVNDPLHYTGTLTGIKFTIAKAALIITPDADVITTSTRDNFNKEYGNIDPTYTYRSSAALIAGNSFTGALSRTAGEAVASYPINIGTLATSNNSNGIPNYSLSLDASTVNLIIGKKTLTVTPNAVSKTYDGNTQVTSTLSFTVEGVVGADVVSVVITGSTTAVYDNSTAGTGKTITVTNLTTSGAAANNYTVPASVTNSNSTILPASMPGVTFQSASVVYTGNPQSISIVAGGGSPAGITTVYSTKDLADNTVIPNSNSAINAGSYEVTAIVSAPNYNDLVLTATLTITKADIPPATFTFSNQSFVYDNSIHTITIDGSLAGVTVNYTDNSKRDVGIYSSVATLQGSNYKTTTLSATLTITKRPITITADNATKVYGDVEPTFNGYSVTSGTLATNDLLTGNLSLGGTATNVGSYSISNFTQIKVMDNGTDNSANYTITGIAGNFTITKRPISYSSVTPNDKIYDGSKAATFTLGTLQNIVNGDVVTCSYTAEYDTRDVGNNKPISVSCSLDATSDINYSISKPSGLKGNITPRALTADGFAIASKAADGTNTATVSSWGNLTPVVSGDDVSITQTGVSATFPQTTAGQNLTITIASPLVLEGTHAANYTLVQPIGLKASIGSGTATFDWGLFSANQTVAYDGNQHAAQVTVKGAGVAIPYSITYAKAGASSTTAPSDAGVYSFTVESTDASYVGSISGTLTITPQPVTFSISKITKEYDRLNSVAILPTITINGLIAADALLVSVDNSVLLGTYNDANAANNKTVNYTNIVLIGSKAANYSYSSVGSGLGDITPYGKDDPTKQPVITFNPVTKVFDGTTSVTMLPTQFFVSGLLAGDEFTVTTTLDKMSYANATVGNGNKVVNINTLTGFIIESGKELIAANYTMPITAQNSNSSITKLTVVVPVGSSILSIKDQSKYYDGSRNLVPELNEKQFNALNGLKLGFTDVQVDTFSVALYDSKEVGDRVINITDIVYKGSDLANYDLPTLGSFTNAKIDKTPFILSTLKVTFPAITKVYDGKYGISTTPILTVEGIVAGDDVRATVNDLSKVLYLNRNVGTGKTVEIASSAITYSGTDAGNYDLASITSAVNNNSQITKLDLTAPGYSILSFSLRDKVYDSSDTTKQFTTPLTVTMPNADLESVGLDLTNVIAKFSDRHVAENKNVVVSDFTYTGAAVSNYVLPTVALGTGRIIKDTSPANKVKITFDPVTKVYDGTNSAREYISNLHVTGLYPTDIVVVSFLDALFDNKNVGVNKNVTTNGMTFGGADAGNYDLASFVTLPNGTITQLPIITSGLQLTIDPQTKVYNHTTAMGTDVTSLNLKAVSGLLAVDADAFKAGVTTPVNQAKYDTKDVGYNDKKISAKLVVGDVVLAANYQWPDSVYNYVSTITPLDIPQGTPIVLMDSVVKVYDGKITIPTMPILTLNPAIIGSDDVQAQALDGSFDTKDVGTGKSVTISVISYSGTNQGNYKLPQTITSTKGRIYPKTLPLTSMAFSLTIDDQTKTYDGTTDAYSVPAITIKGLEPNDNVTAKGGTPYFTDKNVPLPGGFSTYVLPVVAFEGPDAANYKFTETEVRNTNSQITPKLLTASFSSPVVKEYDGNNSVTNLPEINLSGIVAGDDVAIDKTQLTGTYNNKDVGKNKSVTLSGVKNGKIGSSRANYDISDILTLQLPTNEIKINSTISTSISIVGGAISKVYDGTKNQTLLSTQFSLTKYATTDDVSIKPGSLIGAYNQSNVGNNLDLTIPIELEGADAANYGNTININTLGNINPFSITVTAKNADKLFYSADPLVFTYELNKILPNGESLNGTLVRESAQLNSVGSYKILQGSLTQQANPNYLITYIEGRFDITTDLSIDRKYGYVLFMDNSKGKYSTYQWYRNGILIPGAQSQYFYEPSKQLCGKYTCEVTITSIGQKALTIEREETDCQVIKSYHLYPTYVGNNSSLHIESNVQNDDFKSTNLEEPDNSRYSINIYEIDGRLVRKEIVNSIDNISIPAPSADGIYIVKVYRSSDEVLSEKIVVQSTH